MDPLRFAAAARKTSPTKKALLLLDALLIAANFLLCGYTSATHDWTIAIITGLAGTTWLAAGGIKILSAYDPEPIEYERRY